MAKVDMNRRWYEKAESVESDEGVIAQTDASALIEQSIQKQQSPFDSTVIRRGNDINTKLAIIGQVGTRARKLLSLGKNWRQDEVV
jgi:hypothetical protein